MASLTHPSDALSELNTTLVDDLFSQDDCIIVDHPSSNAINTPPSSLTTIPSSPPSVEDIVKTKRWAWVWMHMPSEKMDHIYRDKKGRIEWRCQHCSKTYLESGGTRIIVNHLKGHGINNKSARQERLHRVQGSIEQAMAVARASSGYKRRRLYLPDDSPNKAEADTYRIDPHVLELLIVRWMSSCSIALHMVENDEFRALLNYLYRDIDAWLPTTHRTISNWIFRTRDEHKATKMEALLNAKSVIHIILDLWTSPTTLSVLGVVFSFVGQNGLHQTITAAMREIDGSHSGNNIAKHLLDIVKEWGITNKLGWIIMDNATSNDTMMEKLSDGESRY